jgi:Kef-type K+ transport system membrane component KefB
MQTPQLFLLAMLLIFALPYGVWRLGRTEYYAPLVVVQILMGIVLGPGVLGEAYPHTYSSLFTPAAIGALNGVAWWAVILFVWLAGLELKFSDVWTHRGETAVTATLAMGTPLLLGAVAAVILLHLPGSWMGPHASGLQFVAAVGMACSVTALPILVLFLQKLGILREAFGQRILRYASIDDVAIWGVLALVLFDWRRVVTQAGFFLGFAAASTILRKVLPIIPLTDRWCVGLVWLAGCSLAADLAGLHFMVGAYLAGAVIEADWLEIQQIDRLREFLLLTLMPVFFLSTGLKTHWDLHSPTILIAAGLLLLASTGGKLAGTELAGRLLGWPKHERRVLGWLLQTKALILIIFVDILLSKGIITAETFTAFLLMAVGSTMATIPMVAPRIAADIAPAGAVANGGVSAAAAFLREG